MNAHALAGYVDAEELRAVFARAARPGTVFILEAFADLRLGMINADDAAAPDPTSYEEGRIFDGVFELHWQRLRGYPAHVPQFRVSLISDDEGLVGDMSSRRWITSSGGDAASVALATVAEGSVYVWGEAVGGPGGESTGSWYEKEVPRLFEYPLGGSGGGSRVKLVTKSYRLRGEQGRTAGEEPALLQRFVGFTSA